MSFDALEENQISDKLYSSWTLLFVKKESFLYLFSATKQMNKSHRDKNVAMHF